MSIRQGNNILAGKSTYRPSLFDFKWADHALTDASWLSADTFEWHDGNDYSVAMNHLINDLQATSSQIQLYAWSSGIDTVYTRSGTPLAGDYLYTSGNQIIQREGCSNTTDSITSPTEFVVATWDTELNITFTRDSTADVVATNWDIAVTPSTETIGATTITYYVALDGHKLILPDQIETATAIYNNTGIAWYYIVDLYNNQFKLPRSKHNVVGLRNAVGKYVQPGLPDHTHAIKFRRNDSTGHHANGNITPHIYTPEYTYQGDTNAAKNASENNPIYGSSDTVQSPATETYLYFYVGNFPELNQDNILDLVHKSGNETITGQKTFNQFTDFKGTIRIRNGIVPSTNTTKTTPIEHAIIETTVNSDGLADGMSVIRNQKTNGSREVLYRAGFRRIPESTDPSVNNNVWPAVAVGVQADNKSYISLNAESAHSVTPISSSNTTDTYIATTGWVNNPSLSTNVVHRTGTETISGTKTFSNDMNVNAKLKVTGEITGRFRTASCHQGQDNTNCWFKLGTFNSPNAYNSHFVIFKMWCGSVSEKGSVNGRIVTRSGSNGTAGTVDEAGTRLEFDFCPSWLKLENFKLLYKANQGSEGSKYALFELWVKTHTSYSGFTFSIEDERSGGEAYNTSWTFYNKTAQTGESQASLPSGYTQLNSVVVNNQNTATTDGIYDWMGTLAQYNSQNIANTHPEWLCFITDDHTATAYSAYSKTESDSRYVKTADINTRFSNLLSTLYPVGSIYIGTQASCPLATLISGSTWVLVGQDRALWGGNGSNGNTTIEAGLPNITGSYTITTLGGTPSAGRGEIAITSVTRTNDSWGHDGSYGNNYTIDLDASRSSSIYGKSSTVQPKAYHANIWRRTA